MTNATRQATYTAKQLQAGLVRRCIWVHPQDWEAIKAYARQLAQARKEISK